MKLKLIHTGTHLLLCDLEGEIMIGDYFLLGNKYINTYKGITEPRNKTSLIKKIIAYRLIDKTAFSLYLTLLPKFDSIPKEFIPEIKNGKIKMELNEQNDEILIGTYKY